MVRTRNSCSGSKIGCRSASSASASIVSSACSRVSRPSATASRANRTAAWAGRLAARVCSRYRRPSSIVNSTSCMSSVVGLERREVGEQLRVGLGQALGERVEVLGVAGARDHVLALRVGEEVAGWRGRAGAFVAAERDSRAGGPATVAEHHLLHVDRRAPVVGDAVDAAVGDRALAVPGVEDGRDRPLELAPGLARGTARRCAPRTSPNLSVSSRRISASSSVSASTPARALASASSDSKTEPGMPSTTLPNICTNRRYASQAKRSSSVLRASPATDSSLRPRLRTVSSIPGIETRAPERTETNRGSSGSPSRLPALRSSAASASSTWSASPSGGSRPASM